MKTCKQLNLIKVMHSVKFGDEVSGAMLRNKLKEEIDRMEQEEIIVKVQERTDWVHNPVII